MPRKSASKKRVHIAKETRGRARKAAGQPPPEKVILDKRSKAPKHKKALLENDFA
jgi:hypothetical protein